MSESTIEQAGLPRALIAFEIGGQEFCLNVKFMMAILNPNEKNVCELNHFDNVSTVTYWDSDYFLVDLLPLLKAEKFNYSEDNRLVLIEYKDCKTAFWVERVMDVIVRNVGMGDLFTFEPVDGSPVFSGRIRFGKRGIWLLDFEKILLASATY